jgi:hypothetical protein
MTKSNRPKVPQRCETDVLIKSGRRCALCFGLEGDGRIKQGQIAHLDRNRENNQEDNLAFLCLIHHDQYDTKTSQSKGITQPEVKKYREKLYQSIENELLPKSSEKTLERESSEIIEHDRKIFQKANKLLPEEVLESILSNLKNDHSYYLLELKDIENFIIYFEKTENYFLCEKLDFLRRELIALLQNLDNFLGLKFFRYPEEQTGDNTRFCLQPDLNIDREGHPSEYTFTEYGKLTEALENHCIKASKKYKEYRLQIKKMLII